MNNIHVGIDLKIFVIILNACQSRNVMIYTVYYIKMYCILKNICVFFCNLLQLKFNIPVNCIQIKNIYKIERFPWNCYVA